MKICGIKSPRALLTIGVVGVMVMVAVALFIGGSLAGFKAEEEKTYREKFWNEYRVYAVPVPEEMTFAGEKAPLWDFEFRERVERELLQNAYGQATMLLYMKRASRWFPMIEKVLKAKGIPDDFKFLAVAESGLANAISSAEAVGFWQFLAATARQYGLQVNDEVDQRYDPWLATEAACRYLLKSHAQFGNWSMVAASYNMGTSGLQQAAQYQGKDSYPELHLNNETSRYLPRILAIKTIMKHPERYGFHLTAAQLYLPYETTEWTIQEPVANWAVYARSQGMDFRQLKIFNPWIRKPFLHNKDRRM
ncbi:MAG: lytic transglycosylase domain-containing protein, partial [Bacteroidetes bacterium]|nr:lytic transglycosylase domain-containing protein [Bacteroidota bacterium]